MRRKWGLEDLIECWTLDEEELALLTNKSGATRRGFAVILNFFEQEARFPRREDIPRAAVEFMAGWMWIGNSALVTAPWNSVGPSSTPARISPMTAGWPSRRHPNPSSCATMMITASASSICTCAPKFTVRLPRRRSRRPVDPVQRLSTATVTGIGDSAVRLTPRGAAARRLDVCAQPGQQRAETLARGKDRRHVLNRADGLQLAPDEERTVFEQAGARVVGGNAAWNPLHDVPEDLVTAPRQTGEQSFEL